MIKHIWLVLVVYVASLGSCICDKQQSGELKKCLSEGKVFMVADNFYGVINGNASCWAKENASCVIFLQKNESKYQPLWKQWPQVAIGNASILLYLPKNRALQTNLIWTGYAGNCINNRTGCNDTNSVSCKKELVQADHCKQAVYDKQACNSSEFQDKFMINMTKCVNCNNPVQGPDETIPKETLENFVNVSNKGEVSAAGAVNLMTNMNNIVATMNGTTASLSMGSTIDGMLLKQDDPQAVEPASFAYASQGDQIKIVDPTNLNEFTRSVTVPKEAFSMSLKENSTYSFAAVFRFLNMTKDERNSTILGDEIVAIEMGAAIQNLTNKIDIKFMKIKPEGEPKCHSWNGDGGRPNWTDAGCETIKNADGIVCRCSHLTFFAILLTPINQTISSSDLKNLTAITKAGCGLSMLFLGIMFFHYFLQRKTKAGKALRLLIQLAIAMFLLDLTFLTNDLVANLNNFVGCQIMAAVMHYFLLSTFSWFAVQALHIWLQLYMGGKIEITHYVLKVSILTWSLPGIVAIILIILGKYSEQTVQTDNPESNVNMCWINDNNVHYIVNIGYYALVFLVTFSTAIYIITSLICIKRTSMKTNKQENQNGKNIGIILGLCCVLGVTWGFAFLSYGALRLPGYYIFTILNSFQGFLIFIYYYKTRPPIEGKVSGKASESTTSSSPNTIWETLENPYSN